MTLVNRVSAFFLIALATVLVGYSLLTYVTVRYYLYHRFDEQLHSAFNTLVAAVEVEPDDVKFEPTDHTIRLGSEADVDDIRWVVYDEQQRLVARSQNMTAADSEALLDFSRVDHTPDDTAQPFDHWRLLQHRVSAVAPKPIAERDPLERETLVITVARSSVDLQESLRRMAVASIVLPALCWIVAALAGRWYCRRALAPVHSMAQQARQMATADAQTRIAIASTGDELAELGGAFNQLLDRVHASLARQQRFAGDAAHQLRTPLTVLQGQIEVTLRRERTPQEHRETLTVLLQQTQELRQLVEALLFLARAEDGAAPEDQQAVPLAAWLHKYLRRWDTHPRASDLHLKAEHDIVVSSSPQLLGQLLDNLVSNALKYSPMGTSVVVALAVNDTQATISVRDHGPGIEPSERETIFEPFYRSVSARHSGIAGTGLGLAICRRIAQSLGAQLQCESQPGQGSAFTLVMPK